MGRTSSPRERRRRQIIGASQYALEGHHQSTDPYGTAALDRSPKKGPLHFLGRAYSSFLGSKEWRRLALSGIRRGEFVECLHK
eukprot:8474802-Alexandrium_andersonii.AAC.1